MTSLTGWRFVIAAVLVISKQILSVRILPEETYRVSAPKNGSSLKLMLDQVMECIDKDAMVCDE